MTEANKAHGLRQSIGHFGGPSLDPGRRMYRWCQQQQEQKQDSQKKS